MEKLNWGILGTGSIAKQFARGVQNSRFGRVLAVGSRSAQNAEKFAAEFSVPNRHGSYESLLADKSVDAIYVATPHPMHAQWAIAAAEAKKHLLVEKPIGINFGQAMAIIEAARANDVFLMEAFMYRCHPQTSRVLELIKSGTIGQVRVVHATFSFHWPRPFEPTSRLTNNALGGGAILDVGCYPISFARLIAGAVAGKEFEDPNEIRGVGHLESTGIDGYACASLSFPCGMIAQCSTGIQVNQENVVRIFGTDGSILILDPWTPSRDQPSSKIVILRENREAEEIVITPDQPLYALEADVVAQNISRRQAPPPAMTWADTLGNMKTLDRWRDDFDFVYEEEKLENLKTPASGRPLRVSPKNNMKYGRIPGIDKQISRIGCGSDFSMFAVRDAMAIWDDFYQRGGTFFDTAWHYGGERPINTDSNIGQWVRSRGVRKNVAILGKAGHTPTCFPKEISFQIVNTLERSGLEYLDLLMLHRDNLDIPAGEFIDCLNEHVRAGRIKTFGGSNWTISRVEEANAYAKKKGLQGFTAVSNQFSLARMMEPLWGGCVCDNDPETLAWYKKTGTIMIPWSSQARGFFVPNRENAHWRFKWEMEHVWTSEANLKRLERAKELAAKRNVLPIQIALAFVLCQPFPTFPIIGPRRIDEARQSLGALDIELSPQEVRWLNLQD